MSNQNSISPDQEALSELIAECEEIIGRVSSNLQLIEKSGIQGEEGKKLLDGLYRDMHTMKGSAQLFGFHEIGKLAHAMEASLDPIRKMGIAPSQKLIDASFKCLDLIARIVKTIAVSGTDRNFEAEIMGALPLIVDAITSQFGANLEVVRDVQALSPQQPEKEEVVHAAPPKAIHQDIPLAKLVGEPTESPIEKPVEPPPAPVMSATPEVPHQEGFQGGSPESGGAQATSAPSVVSQGETTIRVQVALLDRLMNLVGELVLARNQVLQFQTKRDDLELLNLSKTLDVVTTDLQGEVMKTRMQPISSVVTKFQRVVRDLSRDLSKKIDLTIQGSETELDKTLLEAIKDPLTHIVRNSCDHGIEMPAERKKAGKPETGHCLIRAYHEGGQVVIEVSDDGKGLNREKLVAKAVEKGLVPTDRAQKMTERESFNLIFLPGFSTAQAVTAVSGRGVGMDVVKTNIEKIGGTVEIQSGLGKGTTIRLKIPLTLAIVPAMLVRSGGERFAIPQVKLVELVRVDGTKEHQIEYLQGRPMYRLRGTLLPLVELDEILDKEEFKAGTGRLRKPSEEVQIVVLNGEGSYFGLIVDEILDKADIVVKPLGSFLKSLSIFSGATIMGDGSISLILDVVGIAHKAHLETKKRTDDIFGEQASKDSAASETQEYLLFTLHDETSHAIPLCMVHRLEEFTHDQIEYSGEQRVVRYREALLPLIKLTKALDYDAGKTDAKGSQRERYPIVVVQRSQRLYGLEVGEITDVVAIDGTIDDSIRDRHGILGNLVHQKEVIAVVDALGVIERETTKLAGKSGGQVRDISDVGSRIAEIQNKTKEMKSKKIRVLYAEDVAFFRKQVAKVLANAGIDVTLAEDGQKALEILQAAEDNQFNLVLSDIEMPRLNGFQLAREIKKISKFKYLPLIALTTRFRDRDIEEGKAAGFDLYFEKLNPDKLMKGIMDIMSEKLSEQKLGSKLETGEAQT